jgi:hypothetical protein
VEVLYVMEMGTEVMRLVRAKAGVTANVKSDVAMAGSISGVCSVIHSSVDMLGAMLLLVGLEGVRSEHVEVSPPSSWGILRRLATTTDLLLTCMASALEKVLAHFCG